MSDHDPSVGPQCAACDTTEARCSRVAGCCDDCTHWTGYDEAGNDIVRVPRPAQRPSGCGTTAGYDRHIKLRQVICYRCRRAQRVMRAQQLLAEWKQVAS